MNTLHKERKEPPSRRLFLLTVRTKIVATAYENCSYCVRKLLILRQKILPEKKIKSYYVFKFSLTLAKKNLSRKFSETALKKIFALRVFCFFAKSF